MRAADERRVGQGGSAFPIALATLALFALSLWWMAPGIAAYDTIKQYEQALSGHYDDWHPPIMARLWSGMLAAGGRGTAPMFLLQAALYWAGLGLLASGLARAGSRGVGWVALLLGLSPITLNWLPVIVKDTQMIAALVAAVGIVAWYRLQGRRLAGWAVVATALLLGYAALVRANGVFAAVPLALMLGRWGGVRRWWARLLLLGAATLFAIGVSGPINHRLLGAARSGVENTLPLFDMAGIANDAPLAAPPGLTPEEWAQAQRRHCYTPFYWDPFGDRTRCGPLGDAIAAQDDDRSPLRLWAGMIAAHPLAYAEHRLAHLNATLRIATPADEKSAPAPSKSDANPYALGGPLTRFSGGLKALASAIERTPLGSPAVWLVFTAAVGWVLLGARRQPPRDLGLAVAASGMLMTASFAVVSIASDLRYHLWPIMAAGLAAVLLAGCDGIDRRRLRIGLAVTAVAVLGSLLLRATAAPMGY